MGRGSSGIGQSSGQSPGKKNTAKGLAASVKLVEDRIRGNNVESAILFDDDGNVLFDTSTGQAAEVGFTQEQVDMAKGKTLTHNHPHGYYFSDQDLRAMEAMDLRQIRATTPDGRAFVLEKSGSKQDPAGLRYGYGLRMYATAGFATSVVYDSSLSHSEIQHLATLEHTRIMNDWLKNNAKKYGYEFREE